MNLRELSDTDPILHAHALFLEVVGFLELSSWAQSWKRVKEEGGVHGSGGVGVLRVGTFVCISAFVFFC